MKEYFDALKVCPLFRGVEEEHYAALLDCLDAQRRAYPRGTAIFHAGEAAVWMGIVLAGHAQVCREDTEGNRAVLAALSPGELFGEAHACAHTPRLPVSVWAQEDCAVLLLRPDKLTTVCPNACPFHGRLAANLPQVLAEKNIFLTEKMEHLEKRTLREKLLSYLRSREEVPGVVFTLPFDRQALADYLCADRSALSREIGRLRREGVLEAEGPRFRLQ